MGIGWVGGCGVSSKVETIASMTLGGTILSALHILVELICEGGTILFLRLYTRGA